MIPLSLTMEENLERCTTVCTMEVSREREINVPRPPIAAVVGDDWISLQSPHDANRLTEMGYFDLAPEGLAMKFLRLAWLAAHDELRRRHAPFDGSAAPSWDKS